MEAIRVRLTDYILQFPLQLSPSGGKIRHALYELNCVEKEEISEYGEFLLSIRLEKTEWLKLVKRFPTLEAFNPIQPEKD